MRHFAGLQFREWVVRQENLWTLEFDAKVNAGSPDVAFEERSCRFAGAQSHGQ